MDATIRRILEQRLEVERESLEDERRAIVRIQRELESRMGFRDRAAEAVSALERELYADRSYAEAVCIAKGCGLPRYIHGGPGRATHSDHRFQAADDA